VAHEAREPRVVSEIRENPHTERREMTPEQILERERLNVENTAERVAARAAAGRAALNGREVKA
jgi:hypothetical protein